MTRILVVDDEPGIVRFLTRAFLAAGYDVESASTGLDGLRRAGDQRFDLITLDLLLPGLGGMAVLGALMEQDPSHRVFVLSAAGGVSERVRCLENGAVDFLLKPFAMAELLARVRSRLQSAPGGSAPGTIDVGGVRLDSVRRTVTVDGRTVELSSREFLVLAHLIARDGRVCSRQELLSEVWGLAFDPGSNVVDVCVARLRAKLAGSLIETVRNAGYAFVSA
jgi:DNA-binding response OmpR family regulator